MKWEDLKWIFDGIGIVVFAWLLRLVTQKWNSSTDKQRVFLISLLVVLLLVIFVLQYVLFKEFWLSETILNKFQFLLITFLVVSISILSAFTYTNYKLIDLKKELEIVKASDNFYDNTTKLQNSKAIEHQLLGRINKAKDLNVPISLLLVDIDYFKKFNEQYSTSAADNVLFQVGQILKGAIRKEDRIFRFRIGDEFLIIAFDTNLQNSELFKNRLTKLVKDNDFQVEGYKVKIDISIGYIEYNKSLLFSDYQKEFDRVGKELINQKKLRGLTSRDHDHAS